MNSDQLWAELRILTVSCQGTGMNSMRGRACTYCDDRFAKIQAVVERLRDAEVIREERMARDLFRAQLNSMRPRRLPPRSPQ